MARSWQRQIRAAETQRRAQILLARDPPSCVAGPGFGGLVGVEKGDLRAVSERFGDERGWALKDEFADRTVARTEEADAKIAEPVHDRVRMEVATGESAREQPRTVRASASAEVRPRGEMRSHERRERLGNIGGVLARVMLIPVSPSSMTLVWSATTFTRGWA